MHREIATRSEDIGNATTEIIIKVDNNEDGYFYPWNPNKFEDRLQMMRELLNDYFDTNQIPDFSNKDHDPFWDPPQPLQIGVSFLSLKMLAYCFENEAEVKIFSSEGTQAVRGQINLAYYPCDESGTGEPPEDMIIDDEDPSALVGKDLYFRVEIKNAKDLPKELCKDTFVTYELKSEPGRQFRTKNFPGLSTTPNYDYTQLHSILPITDYYLDWLEKDQVSALKFY